MIWRQNEASMVALSAKRCVIEEKSKNTFKAIVDVSRKDVKALYNVMQSVEVISIVHSVQTSRQRMSGCRHCPVLALTPVEHYKPCTIITRFREIVILCATLLLIRLTDCHHAAMVPEYSNMPCFSIS